MEFSKNGNSVLRFNNNRPLSFYGLSFFFFFFSFCVLLSIFTSGTCVGIRSSFSTTNPHFYLQDFDEMRDRKIMGTRRLLSGPGSSPPRCMSKCGRCSPCKPVHVPVPPGTPVTAEYYPEAWRCKCGNKLYIP
ncbi:EPIDERMAL PATTERNING FACTOR-like protein 6 [Mercurialis annua]|uniref:EPIDERMAL PATTERNING FACTOR-like protein 6 n=1 Tax=Mercurialis annua TaxID=3986 RepID=UPI00215F3659|nr:EPIDERMAL PATTERNING FACTOR-like protein 6 [Mercurialis annua]